MNVDPLDTLVETRDVNRRFIVLVTASLLALLIVGVFAAWFIFEAPLRRHFSDAPKYSLSNFAHPRLQAYPREDLKAVHAREDGLLNSYGRASGRTRIPIERALELAAEKHLIPDHPPKEAAREP